MRRYELERTPLNCFFHIANMKAYNACENLHDMNMNPCSTDVLYGYNTR